MLISRYFRNFLNHKFRQNYIFSPHPFEFQILFFLSFCQQLSITALYEYYYTVYEYYSTVRVLQYCTSTTVCEPLVSRNTLNQKISIIRFVFIWQNISKQ